MFGKRLGLPLVDERTKIGLRVARIPRLEFRNLVHEFVQELAIDAALHQDAVGTHANLSLMSEAAENGGIDRGLQVGILQHDKCAVSSQLQDRFLQRSAGNSTNVAPHALRPGE